MKKNHYILLVFAVMCMVLASCKSSQTAVSPAQHKWQTAELPIKVELLSPQHVTISGRAYMERGQSAFFSGRMLGFEIGQVSVTPNQLDLVMRQPEKIWVSQELGEVPIDYAMVQDALIGDLDALLQLASEYGDAVVIEGTAEAPAVTISAEKGGLKMSIRLVPDLTQIRLNKPLERRFENPGSAYRKMDAKTILNLLR